MHGFNEMYFEARNGDVNVCPLAATDSKMILSLTH